MPMNKVFLSPKRSVVSTYLGVDVFCLFRSQLRPAPFSRLLSAIISPLTISSEGFSRSSKNLGGEFSSFQHKTGYLTYSQCDSSTHWSVRTMVFAKQKWQVNLKPAQSKLSTKQPTRHPYFPLLFDLSRAGARDILLNARF